MKVCTYTDTAAGAQSLVELTADDALADFTRDRANGTWEPDPQVRRVWGFRAAATDRVVVVAYLDTADLEADEDYLADLGI